MSQKERDLIIILLEMATHLLSQGEGTRYTDMKAFKEWSKRIDTGGIE